MASTGGTAFAPVLAAMSTMQSSTDREQKSQANEYLQEFQRSVNALRTGVSEIPFNNTQDEAWTSTLALLAGDRIPVEAKLFAATTLKGKVKDMR